MNVQSMRPRRRILEVQLEQHTVGRLPQVSFANAAPLRVGQGGARRHR
jgi:hypothetical protein